MDPDKAKTCFWSNLAMPGIGSLHGGRGVGWLQVLLAGAGFVSTNYFGLWFLAHLLSTRELPFAAIAETGRLPVAYHRPLLIGCVGIALFATAFLWALATSFSMLRAAKSPGGKS